MEEIVLYLDISRLSTGDKNFFEFLGACARKKRRSAPIQFIWEAARGVRSSRRRAIDTESCDSRFEEATAMALARLSSKARITAMRRSA